MARYKYTEGQDLESLIDADYSSIAGLSISQLREVVGRLGMAANKRIQRIEKVGESTPATEYVERSGGRFSVKGKNLNQLRTEYVRARDFLKAKTGTVKGYRQMMAGISASMKESGRALPEGVDPRVGFKIFDRLRKIDPQLVTESMKYDIVDIVSMLPGNWTYRGKLREAHRRLRQLEEERMRTGQDIAASDFWSDEYEDLDDDFDI